MAAARESDQYWLARSVRTVLFLAVVLTIAGILCVLSHAHRRISGDKLSARSDRRGQRRHAGRADAGHYHQAD